MTDGIDKSKSVANGSKKTNVPPTNNNENSGRKIQTIYIVCVEEDVLNSVQKIARELWTLYFIVLTETLRRSMKAQMREANKCNADLAIIIGNNLSIFSTHKQT